MSGAKHDDSSEDTLSELFGKALQLHTDLSDSDLATTSEEFQKLVQKGILMLEDSTRLVSILDIFSRNENVSEVQADHLKYFLLPVLLGELNGRLHDPEGRLEIIKICQVYYLDFLNRCKDYEVMEDISIPKMDDDEDVDVRSQAMGRPDLAKMTQEREAKLKKYRERKELEARLKELKVSMEKPSQDEDVVREYYLSMIKSFIYSCQEELESFKMEKQMIAHMSKIKRGEIPDPKKTAEVRRPFKPIIITKDAFQKEVFGLGYKSLPVMSVEEFYDQRVRDGWFPDPAKRPPQKSLQDMAKDADNAKLQEDEEARIEEEKEERDDEETLARKRGMDEYKDEHKRGEGNRYNMG